jgi:glycosyltransferase involved in cell wall biosynthesis
MLPRNKKYWLMIGPSLDARGGMTSVVRAYRTAGLFEHDRVRYLTSYRERHAWIRLWVCAACMCRLFGALALGQAAGVHLHSASRGSFWRKASMAWLARLFGVPYLFHIHSGEFLAFYRDECGSLAKRLVGYTLRTANHVIVLSDAWRQDFDAAFPGLRLQIVKNPIDVPKDVQPCSDAVPRVLFLGRIRDKKGVYDLLEAMALVRGSVPNAELVLAGDGELDQVRKRAVELGVGDGVKLPGWLEGDAKFAALQHSHVMALPSYFEGLPIGVLEAMAMGSLVVATRVGGIPDVIRDGENGLLVDAGDVPALAHQLSVGLTHAARRAELVATARRDVEAYRCEHVVEVLRTLYQHVNPMKGVPV